jgi:hypothetical protein
MIRFAFLLLFAATANALDYPHVTAEPQKTGWPLTAEERPTSSTNPSTTADQAVSRTSTCRSFGPKCPPQATSAATPG